MTGNYSVADEGERAESSSLNHCPETWNLCDGEMTDSGDGPDGGILKIRAWIWIVAIFGAA